VTSFGFAVGVPACVCVGAPLGLALALPEGDGDGGGVVLGAVALGRTVAVGVAPALRLAVGTEVGRPSVPLRSPVSHAQSRSRIARKRRMSI
jgi:hypothetical protein